MQRRFCYVNSKSWYKSVEPLISWLLLVVISNWDLSQILFGQKIPKTAIVNSRTCLPCHQYLLNLVRLCLAFQPCLLRKEKISLINYKVSDTPLWPEFINIVQKSWCFFPTYYNNEIWFNMSKKNLSEDENGRTKFLP